MVRAISQPNYLRIDTELDFPRTFLGLVCAFVDLRAFARIIAAVQTRLAEETSSALEGSRRGAEGATAPEPLRQMDRKLMALWKAAGPPAGSPKG
jgi:hypothetical protein